MRVLLLLLALSTGCDRLFGLSHLDEPAVLDAPRDGAGDGNLGGDARADSLVQTHSGCPEGFANPYENSLYRYVATPSSWSNALAFCDGLDDPTSTKRVHLAVLTSDFERSTHISVVVVGSASAFWIGLSDTAVEGTYQWVTAEPVQYPEPTSWGALEPSEGPDDDCVRVEYSTNDLDSMACATPSPFVCECDDYATRPASYQ